MRAEKLLEEAKLRFDSCVENENDVRKEAEEDFRMLVGEQWDNKVKNLRGSNRPCLTINRLPQFVRQVTNDARQNRPSVKFLPVDDGDVEVAEIYTGLYRHIEKTSDAAIAYDAAVENQVTGGFGYFRVVTEYCDEKGFNQEIKIKRVLNPFTVYFDPNCIEPDYSDAEFAFVVEEMTSEAFKEKYPESKMASLNDFSSIGDDSFLVGDTVRIVEYFKVIKKEKQIYLLEDGSVVEELPDGVTPVQQRKMIDRRVMWYKLCANDILEEKEWIGRYIPIIPVLGEEHIVDGKRMLIGLVRYARDPQKMLNYWVSAHTEAIALSPKAPFIAAEGQTEQYKEMWENANVKNYSTLVYKPTSHEGNLLPAPHRQTAEPAVQAMGQSISMAGQFLKDTTGIYDASLGAHGNETSGRAILARQKEGDVSTFHFIDNFSRSIKFLGKILLDLFPKIYDAPRIIRILGEDNTEKMVPVNSPTQQNGIQKFFDLTSGQYDVVIETGPSFSTKREQAANMMVEISKAYPQLWGIAGDLMVKNFDWPGANALSERLRLLLPPQVQQHEQSKDIPPQMIAQMQEMQKMMDGLTQELHAQSDEVQRLKSQEDIRKMEIESRERIAALEAQVEIAKTQANLEHKGAMSSFQEEMRLLHKKIDSMYSEDNKSLENNSLGLSNDVLSEWQGAP